MAVTDVHKVPTTGEGRIGSLSENEISEVYQVICDSRYDTRNTIAIDPTFTANVPSVLSPHPDDPRYTLKSIDFNRQGPIDWRATCNFNMAAVSYEEREKIDTPNPLDRRPKYSTGTAFFQRYTMKDANGVSRDNSAGEPFPARAINVAYVAVNVRVNVTAWNATWYGLCDTLNSSSVTIFDGNEALTIPASQGVLRKIGIGELQEENGILFYRLDGEIHVARSADDWKEEIADTGFNYLDGSDIKRIQVKDQDGNLQDCVSEQFLDGSGSPLYPGGVHNGSDPYFWQFDQFTSASWSSLPFFS